MSQLAFNIEEVDQMEVIIQPEEYIQRKADFWTAINNKVSVLEWAMEIGEIYENVNPLNLKLEYQIVVEWYKAGMPLQAVNNE